MNDWHSTPKKGLRIWDICCLLPKLPTPSGKTKMEKRRRPTEPAETEPSSDTGVKPDFSAFLVAGKTSRTPTPTFLSDEIHY